ncbi:MAG: protein kinase [Actinomycetota bacterium]|nr:protein kinase [Actinomycetota bacterium]
MTEPPIQTETPRDGGAKTTVAQGLDVILGGRYLLAERIADGGMAAVWKAHDQVLDRAVAVKVLHDHLAADDGFRERFRREAISAAKLTHPHVVSLYDTGSDGDQVYLVMEFVDGSTLKDVIAEHGRLDPGRAASIGEKVARALDYAHRRGLVHRDVKPANILIGKDGSVKVADFGIAKADENEGDLTKTGTVLGTAAYVAPEQITGDARIDGRADQYGLGCMLYEALTGRQPFKGASAVATAALRLDTQPLPLRSACPELPPGLDAIIMRSLSRTPDDRYPSAGHLADALAAFAQASTASTASLTTGAVGNGRGDGTMSLLRPAPSATGSRPGTVRWLLPTALLVLVVGTLIGFALLNGNGVSPASDGGDPGGQPGRIPGGAPDGQPYEVTAIATFDPQGDGTESDEQLPDLLDGDRATTWQTETYNGADFGGLAKQGVGFVLDLGQPRAVSGVRVRAGSSDLSYEVRVAAEPFTVPFDGTKLGSVSGAGARSLVAAEQPVEARYILVLIIGPLPPQTGGYRAELSEVAVLGAPG